ncbi:two-component sensor histidine kinase [Nocardiopsis gilva YIM 90087]|uniref:histidine kinase n=2 Tax=Nocardiopsis gilva TaxID=280236 RepID=A0A223S8B5_9ACTN|nr:two-component sensor histidine kinase [Nocardiopsis gilva YIM 90087]
MGALRRVVRGEQSRALDVVLVVGALGLLGAAWVVGLGIALGQPSDQADWLGPPPSYRDYLPIVSGGVMSLIAVSAVPHVVSPRRTGLSALAAAGVMLATSVALMPGPKGLFGYALAASEGIALFLVVTLVALRCRPRTIAGISALAMLCLASDTLRSGQFVAALRGGEIVDFDPTSIATLVLLMLAPGLYLRWRAAQRASHVARARREERLSLARDLHDVVAHQITGIVVQAQALQHVGARNPELAVTALPEIEAAGTRALTAMRRLVGALREGDEVPLEASDLAAALRALESDGDDNGPPVEVRLSGDLAEVAPDVGTAIARMAQEGVTNARRYARDATCIRVRAEVDKGRVWLEVRDDGRGGGSSFGDGGGYGLIGMAERAKLLGGTCTAGPIANGQGWSVRAELPAGTADLQDADAVDGAQGER